jgi:hypothetical protein
MIGVGPFKHSAGRNKLLLVLLLLQQAKNVFSINILTKQGRASQNTVDSILTYWPTKSQDLDSLSLKHDRDKTCEKQYEERGYEDCSVRICGTAR